MTASSAICARRSRPGTRTPAAAQSRQQTGPSTSSHGAVIKAVSAAMRCAGAPSSAAPSAVPGPSPPQGIRQSDSSASAPAGAPARPMPRSAARAKTAPTAKPVTLSMKTPISSVAVKMARGVAG